MNTWYLVGPTVHTKSIYLLIFINNIWSYLLRSPVTVRVRRYRLTWYVLSIFHFGMIASDQRGISRCTLSDSKPTIDSISNISPHVSFRLICRLLIITLGSLRAPEGGPCILAFNFSSFSSSTGGVFLALVGFLGTPLSHVSAY